MNNGNKTTDNNLFNETIRQISFKWTIKLDNPNKMRCQQNTYIF